MIFERNDRIVFAGDSVTDMGSAKPVGESDGDELGFGYVRIIDNMLQAWYPERNIRVSNAGISGNTSRDLLERFERDVISLQPQWVSICIGINDVWRQFDTPAMPECQVSPKEYEANMAETRPAGPPPMTITSYFFIFFSALLQLSLNSEYEFLVVLSLCFNIKM